MHTQKSHLPLVIVLTILLSGLVFTPVLGMPQTDLSWRTSAQVYPPYFQAYFDYYPHNPSPSCAVSFYGYTDPYVPDATYSWDFGDGDTAVGQYVSHQYDDEGDYPVTLTVTTPDTGMSSYAQTVPVRTHDVAIIRFRAPQAAKAGQTRNITVGLSNQNYEELVEVCLNKSEHYVGCLLQTVPLRKGNRTTDFDFSYTFTDEDAAIGKVTFRANAFIVNTCDALPADNEAIADPTTVRP